MSVSFFDLMKYASTGIASPSMTAYDKMRALAAFGGGKTQTLTGVPPLSFKANGKPLISWSMLGNGQQTGTPTPDAPIMPDFCGVRTGNLAKFWQTAYIRATDGAVIEQQKNGMAYPVKLLAGQTITFSDRSENNGRGFAVFQNFDGTTLSGFVLRELTTYTYTATENCYVVVWCNYDNVTIMTESNFWLCKPMLNSGSTALPYEPFGWKIPITCAGQTTPVYLGQVSTVRRIKKLVLTGEENITSAHLEINLFNFNVTDYLFEQINTAICTHYETQNNVIGFTRVNNKKICFYAGNETEIRILYLRDSNFATVDELKTFLRGQYAAGTPVTVWYVLKTPTTAIVNEPLAKIGDYADELHSEDAGVTIPTAKGQNTLTVDTELQPSEMTITGNIKEI